MTWLVLILCYLLGSIPTAYIASRLVKGRDIRQMGDANMGAANVFQQIGAASGITVGIIDASKGALVVLIARAAGLSQGMVLFAGAFAVLGHNFPVFLGFRGGRGVSTSIGVLLVTFTQPMLIMAAPCIVTLILTKNVTRAMAVLFIPLSGLGWWRGLSGLLIGFSVLLPVMVGLTHMLRAGLPLRLRLKGG